MSDCPNVEIRERLPEYLSDTLPAPRRHEVRDHVASCNDCAEELALLQLVREAYAQSAAPVNVGAIVAALPRRAPQPVMKSWRRSHAFQIAAAISFIALGGMSLTVARSFFNGGASGSTVDSGSAVTSGTTRSDAHMISFAGGVGDLGDEDIEALLLALESIEALPVTEPAELPLSTGRQGS
jgi:anti-sigma factor RsiW